VAETVIVIGASAGGVAALQQLVAGFPPNMQAAVLVVLHTAPNGPGLLGEILHRSGPLPAGNAVHGQRIESGRVYVAPPDWHLLCADQHVRLWRGPKENLHRPCINVTFRSASDEYGPHVIGAVLTGTLDDGTAGLWWIRKNGGTVIVQNPANAQYSEMPRNVLRHMSVDYCVDITQMGSLMAMLACKNGKTEELSKKDLWYGATKI
jgi:two-component system chemotaxis response regulator CheB